MGPGDPRLNPNPGDPRRGPDAPPRGPNNTQRFPDRTQAYPEPRSHHREQAPPPEPPEPRSRRRDPDPEPPAKPKSGRSATYSVLLMTGISVLAVGVLAAQAAGQSPQLHNANSSSSQSGTGPGTVVPTGAGATAVPTAANPLAVPANSGSGSRIVYSLAEKRVWLIGSDGTTVTRTFPIVPGTVPVPTGTYHVSKRTSGETGSDGTSVQYVVFFDNPATVNLSTAFAFDTVADVSGLPPAPTGKTGAVRMAQADAGAVWYFAPIGTLVVVV